MTLTKVNSLNYDKKDCQPVECPQCHQMTFSLFEVVQKDASHESHLHIRCIFCDLTWCGEAEKTAEEKQ